MSTPGERLKTARERAGFTTTGEAALALGVKQPSYAQHENGTRGYPAAKAEMYARRFKVSAEWLLYGKGDQAAASVDPTEDELVAMLDSAQREIGVTVAVEGWSRAVASSLRTQLERFRSDREQVASGSPRVRDGGVRLRKSTKPSARE